jgi:hypothetical protein
MNFPSIVCCAFLFLIHACNKPATVDNNEYLVKEEFNNDGRLINEYEYNDSWQITKHVNWSKSGRTWVSNWTNYFYNADGKVERTEYSRNPSSSPGRTEFFYNSQGQLTLVKNYNINTVAGTTTLYNTVDISYKGQQIVQTVTNNTGVSYVTTVTLDNNGNITKKVTDYTASGQLDFEEEYLDYDNKKHFEGPDNGYVFSKNNYRKYIFTTNSSTTKLLYKYTYNNAGYVTKCVRFIEGSSGLDISKYNLIPKN